MTPGGARRSLHLRLAPLWLAYASACSSPSAVALPPLELVVSGGDEQYGTVGQTLGTPLRVLVRTITGRIPHAGAPVTWRVTSGSASFEGLGTTTTDSTGSAEVRLRLGPATGEVRIQATAETRNNPTAAFVAFTVERPELTAMEPASAAPGASVTLTGRNFSPAPEQDVVLFSGIRGRVTAASMTELTVTVPECLPARSVSVSVQLGVVASGALPLSVEGGGVVADIPVGGVLDIADDPGFACAALNGNGSAQSSFLVLVYSTSTVAAALHTYRVTGLASAPPPPARVAAVRAEGVRADRGPPDDGAQRAWDASLRALEADVVRAPHAPRLLARAGIAPAPPVVGERRTFKVYRGPGRFADVTAVASLVSEQAALFVDVDAPPGGFTATDLQTLADRFDDVIHPVVTGAFGAPSDLDGNGRVVILFTPVVNALTPRGATGFVGGFYYGIDLLPDQAGSNGGEVFYALVPDPGGVFSDPRPRDMVMDVTPAILAHEFQHMVHFNQRILVRGAESAEAVWLSEGLAQYAEELVARAYDEGGDAVSASLFRSGARARSRRYLSGPDTVSLIITTGEGSLTERGAGFLDVMYMQDQMGGDLLGRLVRTTRTGVSNVEAETGRPWEDLLADWWSALYLDGPVPESGARVYPTVDLRGYLGDPFPLQPEGLGAGDFVRDGSLWSSSAAYYIVVPDFAGTTTLRVSGEAGGPLSRHAGLRMRVIRLS